MPRRRRSGLGRANRTMGPTREGSGGATPLQRGPTHVQLRRRPRRPQRAAGEPHHGGRSARRHHHGQQAVREHRPVRDVLQPGQSHGGGGHRRRPRGAHAHAVCARHPRPVGARFPHRAGGRPAGPLQRLPVCLRLRRGGHRDGARPVPDHGAVMDDIIVDFPRRPLWRRTWTPTERRAFAGLAVVGTAFGLLPLVAGSGPRDDVQVVANTTTAGSQSAPAVATLPGGKVVVVWEGAGAGDDAGIFARIRDPQSGFETEFRVNEVTDGAQGEAAVAADAAGNFLVAWSGPSAANGGRQDVFTRLFDPTGTALRGEEVLNLQTAGDQSDPAVAAVGLERFAVVFEGDGEEFLAPPAPVSPPAPVEPPDTPPVVSPVEPPPLPIDVPLEPPVVTAQDPAPPAQPLSDKDGIFLRYTGQATEPDQVLVNGSSTAGRQQDPAVAASGSTVMVVWSGAGPDDDDGVYATTVTATAADPAAVLGNTTTAGTQGEPAVVARTTNDFVAVWAGAGPGDSDGVVLRPLDRSVGEVLVNSVTDGDQSHPAVAVSGSGLLTVVWDGPGGVDAAGIHARRFDPRATIGPVTTAIAVNSGPAGVQR